MTFQIIMDHVSGRYIGVAKVDTDLYMTHAQEPEGLVRADIILTSWDLTRLALDGNRTVWVEAQATQ